MSQEDYRSEGRRETHSRASHSGKRLAPSSRSSSRAAHRTTPEGEPRPSRPRKKRKRLGSWGILIYGICVLGAARLLAGVGWLWANDVLALNKDYHTAVVEIQEGDTVSQVADKLKEQGLIEYKSVFKLFCTFTHVSGKAGDDDAKITPGSYELNTDMDYRALISSMGSSSANRLTTTVTIPEGTTEAQIFEMLEKAGVATVEDLTETAANYDFKFSFLQGVQPLGDAKRLEGYLFPDTYTFYLGEDPKYVINKMLVNFESKMEDYMDQFNEESKYSLHDIVTIASMIEKETDGEDYAKISSVIYNRLENTNAETQGYLQIDATLVYINGGKVPSEADKAIDSPYNTYLYKGLPAGPISNPGMTALYAALNPENTSYYYYVLNPATGMHQFAATYEEHEANRAQFAAAAAAAREGE